MAIHFSRQEFSNITTPLFLVTGFFFLFRGLADRRLINFVLAGYAHMLSMYFYMGGRLKLDELITRRYRIEEAPQAFADLASGKNARGVIVF